MGKTRLQQLLIFTPNLLGLEKFLPLPRNFTRTKPCSETPFDIAEVAGGGVVDDAELVGEARRDGRVVHGCGVPPQPMA